MSKLRHQKVYESVSGTQWVTMNGGLFVEPIHRPNSDGEVITISVTIPYQHYRLLEVLYDDVVSFVGRLIEGHCRGLINSQKKGKHAAN